MKQHVCFRYENISILQNQLTEKKNCKQYLSTVLAYLWANFLAFVHEASSEWFYQTNFNSKPPGLSIFTIR